MSRAPLGPQLLELPLLLALFGFSACEMGLAGSDYHFFGQLRQKMAESHQSGLANLYDDGILTVDLALLIIGAVSFFVAIVGIVLCAKQFGGRRGEYTGKGTAGWAIYALVLLPVMGAQAGIAGAYTAFAVLRRYSFTEGSSYSEPLTLVDQIYLRAISLGLNSRETSPTLNFNSAANVVSEADIAPFNVSTLAEVNAVLPRNYVYSGHVYAATIAIVWFSLGTTFLVFVVHLALPFVWKWLGLLRKPKAQRTGATRYYSNYTKA